MGIKGDHGMANKKWHFVIFTAFLFVLLTGCGLGANSSNNNRNEENQDETPKQEKAAATLETSVASTGVNNDTILHYKTKNVSGKTINLTFPSGLKVDYIIYDEQEKKVKQYSDDVMATQAIVKVALENGEEITQDFTISDLPNGKYVVEIFLTANEEKAKGFMDLLIENAPFLNGSGELSGQMDPHTVEIMVDGEPTAFQLSEDAQLQLPLLNEGETVSYLYTEKVIEGELKQKTIEKFVIE
jgi:hypothetical protein